MMSSARPVLASIVGIIAVSGVACHWATEAEPRVGAGINRSDPISFDGTADPSALKSAAHQIAQAGRTAWEKDGLDEEQAMQLSADLAVVLESLFVKDYPAYAALMANRRAVLSSQASGFAENEFQYPEYHDMPRALRRGGRTEQVAFLWSEPRRRHVEITRVDAAMARFGTDLELGEEWCEGYVGMYSVFIPEETEAMEMVSLAMEGELPVAWVQMPVELSDAGETLLRLWFYHSEEHGGWFPMFINVRATGDRVRPMF